MNARHIADILMQRTWHKLTWGEEIKEGVGTGLHKMHLLTHLCRASGRLTGTISVDRRTLSLSSAPGQELPLALTERAEASLIDLKEGAHEVLVTVWPTWQVALSHAPTLPDFEVQALLVNCITLIKEDTPAPGLPPHVVVGGLVQSVHEHGFEIALSSKRSDTTPVYVRALGKLHAKEGQPCAVLIKLVTLGDVHVWMLEREFKVDWKPFTPKKRPPRPRPKPKSKPSTTTPS